VDSSSSIMSFLESTGESDEQRSVDEPAEVTSIDYESPSEKQINDASNFPDGATKAWLNVVGGWCIFFSMFGWANGE
jgi:hypothetical protein